MQRGQPRPTMRRAGAGGVALAALLTLAGAVRATEDVQLDASVEDGVVIEAEPQLQRLHLGALLALDARLYDERNARHSQLRIDRALVRIDGELLEGFFFDTAIDLKGIDTRFGLERAWLAWMPLGHDVIGLRLSAGLMEIPLGVEAALPEHELPFVDYAFPAFLNGRTDWAARIEAEVAEGMVSADGALALGDGYDSFGQRRGEPQLSLKLTSYPFRPIDLAVGPEGYRFPLLSGIFFSGAVAWSPSYASDLDVATSLRNKLFLTPRLEGEGAFFWHFGYGIDAGPVRLIHELVRGSLYDVDLPGGGEEDFEGQITAWALSVSWMITGEPYDSRPFRQSSAGPPRVGRGDAFPRRPLFGGEEPGHGAFEVAVRYANADIDRDLILLGFTDVRTSSQEFRTFEVALNWYPIRSVRLGVQLTRTIADQRPAVFDSHGRDTSGVIRLQLSF